MTLSRPRATFSQTNPGLGKVASEDIIGKFGNTVFVTRTFTIVSEATKWAAEA